MGIIYCLNHRLAQIVLISRIKKAAGELPRYDLNNEIASMKKESSPDLLDEIVSG